ncbi:MAG: RDD family protein [Planctomycetota bacterium]|nr:MAG: RDD family protein [Planctomycetota bacterium]
MDAGPRLDTAAVIETPEGVELALRAAGPVPRSLAWTIDVAVLVAVVTVLLMLIPLVGESGIGFVLLAMFALWWGYDFVCELAWGATPGKRALGLRVVRTDGTPVTWVDSALRNLLRAADVLPFGYCLGLCACLSSPRFQRFGDLVAGTLVVHVDRPRARRQRPEAAAPFAPPLPLSTEEQRTVIDYATRAGTLSRARCVELAEIVEPLVGARGELARTRLLGLAAWLRGDR